MTDVVLGIWDGHDAGAALLSGPTLVAAVNEERLSGRKLDVNFPRQAIQCCLTIAGLEARDVTRVACSTSDVAKALGRLWPSTREHYYAVRRRKVAPGLAAGLTRTLKRAITPLGSNSLTRTVSRAALRRDLVSLGLGSATLSFEDHHRCHALTAAVGSGWSSCTVVTIDGLGDGLSTTVGTFVDGRYERMATTHARCSLGVLFEQVTALLNMRELEDEGKVMALSSYAAPIEDASNPLLDLVHVDGLQLRGWPARRIRRVLWNAHWSHANEQFAYMAQRLVEKTVVSLVGNAVAATGLPKVALAGGVASNIKATRAARMRPEVEDVFVFPHMGDGGLAVGAAWSAAVSMGVQPESGIDPLQLGPEFSTDDVLEAAAGRGLSLEDHPDIATAVGERLARGEVVLWVQGRMEYGPRALGHRSVLARPDSTTIRDRINLLLKRRAWYQPFCPSMLESDARTVLEDWKGAPNRHMTIAYQVRPEWRDRLCGVVGIDGTCRPQIVPDEEEGLFADLLRDVRQRWGVGVVLNTSLNVHGQPLACTPAQALDAFQSSGADAIALDRLFGVRKQRSTVKAYDFGNLRRYSA